MTHNDDDRPDRFNADPHDDVDNEQYSLWKENKKVKLRTNSPEISGKINFKKIGVSFSILLILLLLLFARNKIAKFENRINALENRVKAVEEKGQKLDAMSYAMAKIGEQAQSVTQLKTRLDRVDKGLTSRMDLISKDVEKLKQQIRDAGIRKAKSSIVPESMAKNRYHIVKSGETLYTIGRRYGVTVKELKKINKMSDKGVIRPGQKLLINP